MKVWKLWRNREIEACAKPVKIAWKEFAKTGECIGIACEKCPFGNEKDCTHLSLEHRLKVLNAEDK